MQDYKLRQEIYNRYQLFNDINKENIIYKENATDEEIISDIVDYFTKGCPVLIYPAKSYCVAIIYSFLIQKYFNIDFYEALNDKNLLYNNDKYFLNYSEGKEIYDIALKHIEIQKIEENPFEQVKETVRYFEKEFFIKYDSLDSILKEIHNNWHDAKLY